MSLAFTFPGLCVFSRMSPLCPNYPLSFVRFEPVYPCLVCFAFGLMPFWTFLNSTSVKVFFFLLPPSVSSNWVQFPATHHGSNINKTWIYTKSASYKKLKNHHLCLDFSNSTKIYALIVLERVQLYIKSSTAINTIIPGSPDFHTHPHANL